MSRLSFWVASIDFLQIIRYYAVGALVNAGGYVFFLLLLKAGMGYKFAASLLYLVGALVSFYLNRRLVFESAVSLQSSLARLILMLLVGYILNIAMLYVGTDRYDINPGIVQLLAIVIVSIFFYLVNKFFVHRSRGL